MKFEKVIDEEDGNLTISSSKPAIKKEDPVPQIKTLRFETIPIRNIKNKGLKHFGADQEDKESNESDKIVKKNKDYVEINNGRQKLKIKGVKSPIKSHGVKRLELEHIEEMIANMTVIPDFGFETMPIDKEGSLKGWNLFRDFVQADFKYERLENYI